MDGSTNFARSHRRWRVGMLISVLAAAAVGLSLVGAMPADAAAPAARWQAKIGPSGANGTATLTVQSNGTASLSINLKHLAHSRIYTETLSRGTCAKPTTKLVDLPKVKSNASGAIAKTTSLTPSQAKLVNRTGVVIRFVAGTKAFCGAFAKATNSIATPTPVVTPTPTPSGSTATVAATIPVGLAPEDVAITPTAVFVANADLTISRIDPATNDVLAQMNLGDLGSGFLTSISVGEDGDLWVALALFDANDSALAGKLLRLDPTNGTVKASIPVGKYPTDTVVSPGAIWVTNYGDGTITRIDPATNTATTLGLVAPDAVGVAFGEGSLWVSTEDGLILRIDPATNTVIAPIPAVPGTEGIAVGGGSVWVANYGSEGVANASVLRIDPATNKVVKSIPVGTNAIFLAYGGESVWVSLLGEGRVIQIDPATNAVVARITVAGPSMGIAAADYQAWAVQPNLAGLKTVPRQPGTVTRINF